MKVYSVNGDKKNLLLVDGLDVINGSYTLEKKRGKEGLFIPHTGFPVTYECDVVPIKNKTEDRWRGGLIDYNATLEKAERIIACSTS